MLLEALCRACVRRGVVRSGQDCTVTDDALTMVDVKDFNLLTSLGVGVTANVVWLLGLEGINGEISLHLAQHLTVGHVQRQAMKIANTATMHVCHALAAEKQRGSPGSGQSQELRRTLEANEPLPLWCK